MKKMRSIIFYWAIATLVLCVAYVAYVQTLPPDELVIANSLGFQIIVSLLVVGGPCLGVLFLALFLMAVVRRKRSNPLLNTDAPQERRRAG
jgi:hypothetical protein